ncbi:hypothetical protein [Bdellovibrio sp. KM01]|uniref:hypothetical protein n=1 Tax=Bdellovibrio sp. KM01 TaxID=2748865 RepID=UPI0015E9FAA1|nr:hypothetical protein [Bdellovibrio sp. KM01]QLY24475.1 hypothetical protein HW988_13555 [Bdellovibrio sp. KM01]
MMTFLVISSIASVSLGIVARWYDTKKKLHTHIDKKKLTPLQILYSACFAYPFCAFYLWLDNL